MPGPLSPLVLLAAFLGGAFGAAVGALPSFALTGALVVAGEAVALVGRPAWVPTAATPVTSQVAFGPVFGPHVAFGGGAAAVAYLAASGEGPAGFEYHPAKEITVPLGLRLDVLAVGGVFGVAGHLVAAGATALTLPLDPVALGVVGSALLHRAAFGYSVLGDFVARPLDMSPFERGERRHGEQAVAVDGGVAAFASGTAASGAEMAASGGPADDLAAPASPARFVVEPWLPYQYRWGRVAALGIVVGLAGAAVAYATASAFLAFGASAASLAWLCAGRDLPVTHHVTLPASTVVLALVPPGVGAATPAAVAATVPLAVALAAGATAGAVGALAGELCQRLLYAHAETHLDPPAASIVLTSLAVGLLAMAGVLPSSAWVPVP